MNKDDFKNLPLGSTFQLGNVTLKVVEDVEDNGCEDCFMDDVNVKCEKLVEMGIIPECRMRLRKDSISIILEEVKCQKDQEK